MGRTINDEKKSEFIKFRVRGSFKQDLEELKAMTPGYKNMSFQDFVVSLIEKGLESEKAGGEVVSARDMKRMLLALANERDVEPNSEENAG